MVAREVANLKTVEEIKKALYQKLKDEGTGFKKSDIKMKAIEGGFEIVIKEYEHCPFVMDFDYDEYFGYIVNITETADNIGVAFVTSKHRLDIAEAMLELGYYIGSRF